ncbi:DUF6082 family protein [Streptomyces sp. NBC_01304]|uniref:DUF6082 family protein n=1 Tax=Streptomyces sp. NBC_01304 TaxID=2903818 RepID=UPI002E138F1E|nr:DUF6082 family protein [Streptomyces sp. NBC_01304]
MVTQKYGMRRLGSAVLAGIAGTAGAMTLLLARQRRCDELQLRLDRLERGQARHADLAVQQRLQFDLLSKAMDDPDLAAVLDTYEGNVPPVKHRQFLFANAMYTNALLAYRVGIVSQDEFIGYVRGMLQNVVFREYWDTTRYERLTLDDASDEAELGRKVDELAHLLDEAETEEWWVVGGD